MVRQCGRAQFQPIALPQTQDMAMGVELDSLVWGTDWEEHAQNKWEWEERVQLCGLALFE